MRRDFDFVTMEDYEADTRELSERAASLIAAQMREVDRLKAMIWRIVQAAGGKVEVSQHESPFPMPVGAVLRTWRNEADMTIVFEAVERGT